VVYTLEFSEKEKDMTQMVWEKGFYKSQKGQMISTARPSKDSFRKQVRYMKFLNIMKIILIGGIVIVGVMTLLGI
jgi:hypothetical protein